VDHVRDVRSLLLLKLALLHRSGGDWEPLVSAQRSRLKAQIDVLQAGCTAVEGFDHVLFEWRLASSRAAVAFLDALSQQEHR
jgi:PadR family transcriptional regulator AphA